MLFRLHFLPRHFSRRAFCMIPSYWYAESDVGLRYDGLSYEEVATTVWEKHPDAVVLKA